MAGPTGRGTWEFFVNGKPYIHPTPLRFRGNPTFISNIDYLTGAPGYIDALQVYPGDLNHDGIANFADLLILAQHYGGAGGTFETGDLSGDGKIDFTDLLLFVQKLWQRRPIARCHDRDPGARNLGGANADGMRLFRRHRCPHPQSVERRIGSKMK